MSDEERPGGGGAPTAARGPLSRTSMPSPPGPERPLRVGLLVSYFHPFASGAERQALAQGLELVRRGHSVRVITRSVPGYPIDDEEYQGVQIHRWIKTWDRGPA